MSKKVIRLIGSLCAPLALCLLLAGCQELTSKKATGSLRLAACTASGTLFQMLPVNQWTERYHTLVSDAVKAHLEQLGAVSTMPLQCTAEQYETMQPPSPQLKIIASGLPPWSTPSRMNALSELDFPVVLQELLRVYECSLLERQAFLPTLILQEHGGMNHWEFLDQQAEENQAINSDLRIARPALERTLQIVGGYDLLRPLALDIECIKRTSLDLRNVLGLAAEVSTCLPRSWDGHDSLRDLAPLQ